MVKRRTKVQTVHNIESNIDYLFSEFPDPAKLKFGKLGFKDYVLGMMEFWSKYWKFGENFIISQFPPTLALGNQ